VFLKGIKKAAFMAACYENQGIYYKWNILIFSSEAPNCPKEGRRQSAIETLTSKAYNW